MTTPERSPALQNIPTVAETVRGYSVESWYGLFAPAGTPNDVILKLNNAAKQAEGLVVSTGSPQELDAFVKREETRWKKIIKENNIKPD